VTPHLKSQHLQCPWEWAQSPQPTLGSRVTVCVLCACVVCVSTVYVCAELWMHSVVAAVHRSTRGVASRAAYPLARASSGPAPTHNHDGVPCHGVCVVCVSDASVCTSCVELPVWMYSVRAVHRSLSGIMAVGVVGTRSPQPTLGSRVTVCVLCAVYMCADL
jgi:hypothetical protein